MIDDLLDAWQAEYLPEAKGLRLVGHQWSPRSHEIKDFLAGNLIPYRWLDVARDPDTQSLLDAAGIGAGELPALFFEDGSALRNPEPRQVAERLGRSLSAALNLYDLVIVGAGPAGLAAAVYGASEGLRTLLLDRHAPGGQAGSSSRIENYLGFPGRRQRQRTDAARRDAGAAAWRGVARAARSDRRVDRRGIQAPDAQRRPRDRHADPAGRDRHGVPRASRAGRGGATRAPACTTARRRRRRRRSATGVCSSSAAGTRPARRPCIWRATRKTCRSWCAATRLRDTMSQYLIEQIEKTPNIRLRARTELERVEGNGHVERVALSWTTARVRWRTSTRCSCSSAPSREATGSRRRAARRQGIRDHRQGSGQRTPGTRASGRSAASRWPLETSVPGVFAAGDIRAGAMNRVASAVGEGSMAVRFVHEYLALT